MRSAPERISRVGLGDEPDARELRVVIRIRPIDIAAVVSILLHVAIFTLTKVKPPPDPLGPVSDAPLNVVLAPPQAEPAEPAAPPAAPEAEVVPAPARPAPATRAPPPRIITRRPTPLAPRFPPTPLPPPPIIGPRPPVPAPSPPEPQVDMMAAIEARRAQRRAADAAAARGNPSDAAPQDAAARNLRDLSGKEGVGGVFQVLRKGFRTGEFAFNGFRRGQKEWREVIEVDAGVGGNVELAMVRRMIELIRTHYTGDFQWDSHRLGRVVVLSARTADQEGLEEFLMKEFFGTPVVNPRAARER